MPTREPSHISPTVEKKKPRRGDENVLLFKLLISLPDFCREEETPKRGRERKFCSYFINRHTVEKKKPRRGDENIVKFFLPILFDSLVEKKKPRRGDENCDLYPYKITLVLSIHPKRDEQQYQWDG